MTTNQTILDSTKAGDLIQVNLAEMKGQVADQIRAFLLNMMPQAAFDKVISDAFDKLTKPRRVNTGDRWNEKWEDKPSELEEMVTTEMRRIMQERVKSWAKQWETRASQDIDDTLSMNLHVLANECAKAHLQSVGNSILSSALSAMSAAASGSVVCTGCRRVGHPGDYCGCGRLFEG